MKLLLLLVIVSCSTHHFSESATKREPANAMCGFQPAAPMTPGCYHVCMSGEWVVMCQ